MKKAFAMLLAVLTVCCSSRLRRREAAIHGARNVH